jgi:hypothetical protein
MRDWNVVVTTQPDGYRDACRLLEEYGALERTDFYNVLVMKVADPFAFLAAFAARLVEEPGLLNFVSHLAPLETAFDFASAEDFEAKARAAALEFAGRLGGKRFHVRLHRRGFKGKLHTPVEERFLDDVLLAALEEAGAPGRIAFDDAEAVLVVETVGNRAGMSLWTHADLERYPFLGVS